MDAATWSELEKLPYLGTPYTSKSSSILTHNLQTRFINEFLGISDSPLISPAAIAFAGVLNHF
jgi:hypothetical protein